MDNQKEIINDHYEYIVVGAGIVGAGIFRDLCLHNKQVLLIDKEDISSQTSAASSKMLHGGIRYLENFDFKLVFEALREKNLWVKNEPSIAYEEEFILPVYKNSKWPLFFLRIGLFVYNLLSRFKNKPFKILNKKQTLALVPQLNPSGLRGAGIYSDAIVDDFKLSLNVVIDGLEVNPSSKFINYCELIKYSDDKVTLKYKNSNYDVTFKTIIFATGPFTDQVMKKLNIPWQSCVQPSKGSHIWLKKDAIELSSPLVIQTNDNRVIFVNPQKNSILVGTTEVDLDKNDNLFNLDISEKELSYILSELKIYFPNAKINEDDILSSYAGVRPLVKKPGKSSHKISRVHQVYKINQNTWAIIGGKYTTFREMAQDIVSEVLGKSYNNELSKNHLIKRSLIQDINKEQIDENLLKEVKENEFVTTKEDFIRRLGIYSYEQIESSDKRNIVQSFINNYFN